MPRFGVPPTLDRGGGGYTMPGRDVPGGKPCLGMGYRGGTRSLGMEYPLPSTKGGTPILGLVYPRYFMPRLGIPGVQISRGVHQPGYTGGVQYP